MRHNDKVAETAGEAIFLEETKYGLLQVKATTGSATFFIDEPIGSGLGSGPNPYDLLSAAIGSSSLMTMRLYANDRKLPLEDIWIRVTHCRNTLHARDVFICEVRLTGSLDARQKAKLIEISARSPVQLTLRQNSDVQTILLAEGPREGEAITRGMHTKHLAEACEQHEGPSGFSD